MKGLLSDSLFLNLSIRCFANHLPFKRKPHRAGENDSNAKKPRTLGTSDETAGVELVGSSNNAIARLSGDEALVFDGCATVCLTEGKASMHGYALTRAADILVRSCSTLSSALTFQAGQGGCVLRFSSYSPEQPDDGSLSFTLDVVPGQRERQIRDAKRMQPTIIPCEWSSTADLIMSSCDVTLPVVPVCGEKGVGKSTFARFLVNRLLGRHKAVAYLDTDVGQPEFTVPGCLSLHVIEKPMTGSPVSHLLVPQRCFYYGDITPQSNPEAYANYFKNLYDYFRAGDHCIPLVINSLGWRAEGTGYDLLVDILRYCKPTHVVEIHAGEADGVPPLPDVAPVFRLDRAFSLPERKERTTKAAAQLRALRVLHYFQGSVGAKPSGGRQFVEAAEALVCQVPYQVSADGFTVVHLQAHVADCQGLLGLNAQLVGLATSSPTHQTPCPCLGFGIVRGVDADKRTLYILTPCAPHTLQLVDTILHGRVDIPVALLQTKGYMCPYLCPSQVVEGTGSSTLRRRQRRRNIN